MYSDNSTVFTLPCRDERTASHDAVWGRHLDNGHVLLTEGSGAWPASVYLTREAIRVLAGEVGFVVTESEASVSVA